MAENTYTPTDGMASAARRALKWKEEGRRGGTRVGLARANQLKDKEPLTTSTIMRMYSFFSRHAVDKKATGFSSGEEGFPSPGRVAWDLWGGDAGASWSKQKRDQIMNDRMNKSIWSGVFFPADEPSLVDLTDEEDTPLDEPVVEEAIIETPVSVAEPSVPAVEETVAEAEPAVEEVIDEPAVEEAVVEEPVAIEEEVLVEEPASEPEAVVEEVAKAPIEDFPAPEVTEEPSAE